MSARDVCVVQSPEAGWDDCKCKELSNASPPLPHARIQIHKIGNYETRMNSALFRSIIFVAVASIGGAFAQTQVQRSTVIIQGAVQSQQTPIPGVSVAATNPETGERITTVTDLNGQYSLKVFAPAKY